MTDVENFHKHPMHEAGLRILLADLAHQIRSARQVGETHELTYRLRLLYPAIRLPDEEFEAYFDAVNRAVPPAKFRKAHAWVLEILEHALESTRHPDIGDGDVAE